MGVKGLRGRTFIITGSTQGIGYAMAQRFAAEGAKVVITSRSLERAERVAEELKAEGHHALGCAFDLTDTRSAEDLVRRALEAFQAIDGLINNAALSDLYPRLRGVPPHELRLEDYELVVRAELITPMHLTSLVLPGMMERGRGVIINIASTSAIAGYEKEAIFQPIRAAMVGFTKALASIYGRWNIRANAIAPGNIKTATTWNALTEGERQAYAEATALKRWPEPRDVASLAAWLASEEASAITGQTIIVDAGEVMR